VEPAFTQPLQGEIHSLTLDACQLAADYNATTYTPIVKQLAQDLYKPGGCSVTVTAFSGSLGIAPPAYFGLRSGYFEVPSNGTWYSYTYSGP